MEENDFNEEECWYYEDVTCHECGNPVCSSCGCCCTTGCEAAGCPDTEPEDN